MEWGDWSSAQPPTWKARVFLLGCPSVKGSSYLLNGAGDSPSALVAQPYCIINILTGWPILLVVVEHFIDIGHFSAT